MQPDNPSTTAQDNSITHGDAAAVNLIRQKLQALYGNEPDAQEELKEAKEAAQPRSKHQQYMLELSSSGKSLAEIQTAWHNYYQSLPDEEKHAVWQEFYSEHSKTSHYARSFRQPEPTAAQAPASQPATPAGQSKPAWKLMSASDIKKQLLGKIDTAAKGKARLHLRSLGFGLMMGALSLLVLLFGFFNERFLAPFITPSKSVSSTPIIIDPASAAVSTEPKIIIPKINVELPVVYASSINEDVIDKALEHGVAHYPSTAKPGEKGNSAIFGHSSNNILNPGKYKFAFVLLSRLEVDDTFYINRDGKRYVYKVYEKRVVPPTEISVLDNKDKPATATLITCDPPGTSINRLVVVGEQISPDPVTNAASSATVPEHKPELLASNAPSLWSRITDWLSR